MTQDQTIDKPQISVAINTYNASLHLRRVLESVKMFDEIVVCDMESTDDTVEIARSKGCKIVTFPKGNYSICEPARNCAIQSASNSWVLVVDADELVTDELRQYLYRRVAQPDCPDALYVPRRNMFLGKYIHSSPDYQLRLVRKEKTDWPAVIHRPPVVDGVIGRIPANLHRVCLMHLDDACITDRINKLNRYTDYEVGKRINKKYGYLSILCRPIWFFIRSFIFQGGFRDGKRGLLKSYFDSIYQVSLMAKVLEHKIKDETHPDSNK